MGKAQKSKHLPLVRKKKIERKKTTSHTGKKCRCDSQIPGNGKIFSFVPLFTRR